MVNNKDRRDVQMAYRADKYIFEECPFAERKFKS